LFKRNNKVLGGMKTSESFNKIDEAIFRRKELNSALS
jgi:hypothetical protein